MEVGLVGPLVMAGVLDLIDVLMPGLAWVTMPTGRVVIDVWWLVWVLLVLVGVAAQLLGLREVFCPL